MRGRSPSERAARARVVRRVSKLVEGDVLPLDLMPVPAWLASAWQDREVVEWDGRRVVVVSREGLIAMKRVAGRPQDLADIARLTGADHDDG